MLLRPLCFFSSLARSLLLTNARACMSEIGSFQLTVVRWDGQQPKRREKCVLHVRHAWTWKGISERILVLISNIWIYTTLLLFALPIQGEATRYGRCGNHSKEKRKKASNPFCVLPSLSRSRSFSRHRRATDKLRKTIRMKEHVWIARINLQKVYGNETEEYRLGCCSCSPDYCRRTRDFALSVVVWVRSE